MEIKDFNFTILWQIEPTANMITLDFEYGNIKCGFWVYIDLWLDNNIINIVFLSRANDLQ